MKVRKMLLREETEKVLHTKSNGDKLVVASSGDGYTAFTRDNVRIGHISAETDAAAVAEFSKKEPKYESMNEDYLDSAEFRIQRYEDDIPELFHRVHDGYMNGMVNAKAYADVLAKIYSVLEELDYVDESLKEGYMDAHDGMNHVDTLDMMDALKAVVKEYGHMELVTPIVCRLHDDEHGRRLELNKSVDEYLAKDINTSVDGSTTTDKDALSESTSEQDNKLKDLFLKIQNSRRVDEGILGALLFDCGYAHNFYKEHYMSLTDAIRDGDVEKAEQLYNEHVEDLNKLKAEGKKWYQEFIVVQERLLAEFRRDIDKLKSTVDSVVTEEMEYDDEYDDLSLFNECDEVRKADALYGVNRDEKLTEIYSQWRDTTGILGDAGETYTAGDLRKIWMAGRYSDPSMSHYKGDWNAWLKDTIAQMELEEIDFDESFDKTSNIDLSRLSWQVASYLDVDALGEDKWIEFVCDDPRDIMGNRVEKTMRFEAIGETEHLYGFIRTEGNKVEVKFRNGSEAMCDSAEEVARFVAGEFGISI